MTVQIFRLLGNAQLIRILEQFLADPTTSYSQQHLIKKTKFAKMTVRKWLFLLEKNKILISELAGRVRYYKLNRKSFGVRQLKKFYNVTSDVIQELIAELGDIKTKKAILFGSYARGEDRTDSDIDVLIVTDEADTKINQICSSISKKYKKRIAPAVRTPEEFMKMAKKEEILYRRANVEGVVVYGF